jgi:hypothetical protein
MALRLYFRLLVKSTLRHSIEWSHGIIFIVHDGAGAAEGGSSGACVSQIGGVASGGLHDQGGWRGEAQSAVREAGGGAGTLPLLRPRQLNEVPAR